jgi:regulator of sigma E protease
MLLGLVVLIFGVILNVAFWCALRFGAMRLVGVRTGGLVAALGFDHQPWVDVPLAKRSLFACAGPLGSYLCAVMLITLGTLIAGEVVVDETSMRVAVASEGPAAAAGFQNGDRILKVEDEPIANWSALRSTISKHAGEPIRVLVERGDRNIVLTPTPSAAGKIGVGPAIDRTSPSIGRAIGQGFAGPFQVWGSAVRAFTKAFGGGSERTELSGPVGIAKETGGAASSSGLGVTLKFIGALSSYFILLPIIAALALFPRSRGRARHPSG